MKSPKEQEKASIAEDSVKKVTLTDGTLVTCYPGKGKHVRQAQRLMDGDETKMIFALVAICADFSGRKVTIEDLDEMPAKDIFNLTAVYSEMSF